MLKNFTLAAVLALGTTALAGTSAQPAAAENIRSVGAFHHGGFSLDVYQSRHARRHAHGYRHRPNWRFLKRVRQGHIVCFKKLWRRHDHRFGRRGHRYYHYRARDRRLGYRAVRRLVRQGRRHVLKCYRNV